MKLSNNISRWTKPSRDQMQLLNDTLGKACDEATVKRKEEEKRLSERLESERVSQDEFIKRAFNEIWLPSLDDLATEYKKICLRVLAPDESRISKSLLPVISENIKSRLPYKGILQRFDDYRIGNKRFPYDSLKKKLDEKIRSIEQSIVRDLLIEKSEREAKAKRNFDVDNFLKKIRNLPVCRIGSIAWKLIIQIGAAYGFLELIRLIHNALQTPR
ncbi:MAG: hypothetical protein Q8M71_06755 [Thermodesulfovibrionales bacterium]|nr:hypothetical protein [Thermodesulfovibrionales bacterium]